jgi:aldoxime dehydratase
MMPDLSQLEPAIPEHLRVERTQPLRAPAGYKPEPLAFSAGFDPSIRNLSIIYFGVQCRAGIDPTAAIATIEAAFNAADGPRHWDRARYEDEKGYWNDLIVAYWDNSATCGRWGNALSAGWWHQGLDLNGEIGAFCEAYTPGAADFETTFSHAEPEGLAKLSPKMFRSYPNSYFGSARDRLPAAQTDALEPVGAPRLDPLATGQDPRGRMVNIIPHDNLCLLRSGQDWSRAEGDELAFYLDKIKPSLDAGMIEIRDQGAQLGCYFNRYMTVMEDGVWAEKSYSVSAWHSLAAPEKWVKTPTHLAIFGPWIRHLQQAADTGETVNIRLYHEMMVLKAVDQSFSYFNCHNKTGMLNAIAGVSM